MSENIIDTNESLTENDKQVIFEERWNSLTSGFGQACDEQGVKLAFAIAIHPEEASPIILIRGHQYDVAVLLSDVLRNLKNDLLSNIHV